MFVAYYDLMCNPCSYDVVSFLMFTERERIHKKIDKVRIEILPGPQEGFRRDHLWPPTTQERVEVLNRVIVPMCRMLPSCEAVTVLPKRVDKAFGSIGHSDYTISFKEFTDSYALGIRPLRNGLSGRTWRERFHRRLVTITLRECDHWPTRNSNHYQWMRVVSKLRENYDVWIVRDTARDTVWDKDDFPELEVREAPRSLDTRAATYSVADLNLFVNNGPAWFCLALDAPAIIFRPITETSCYAHTEEAMRKFGVHRDGQMKGAPPHQRLSWVPETADDIVDEVHKYFQEKESEGCMRQPMTI